MFQKHVHWNSDNNPFLAHNTKYRDNREREREREKERERESHAGIITHGDHILLALIVAELVSGMDVWYSNLFSIRVAQSQSQSEKKVPKAYWTVGPDVSPVLK